MDEHLYRYDLSAHPYHSRLDMTYSVYDKLLFNPTTIKIWLRDLLVGRGFPSFSYSANFKEACLIITGVQFAQRKSYISSVKKTVIVQEASYPRQSGLLFYFNLANPCSDPPGFIELEIVAKNIHVEGITLPKVYYDEEPYPSDDEILTGMIGHFPTIQSADIHPDDFYTDLEQELARGTHQVMGVEGDYALFQNNYRLVRVKVDKFVLMSPAKFYIGERVIDPRHPEAECYVTYFNWHHNHRDYFFMIMMDGKKRSKRYFTHDLMPYDL